jgi:hypothetical protein
MLIEFSRQFTRAMAYVMQTSIDPVLILCKIWLANMHLGPYIWSILSQADREKPSLESFKNAIRKTNLQDLVENSCKNCKICLS